MIIIIFIHDATVPKSQDRLKRLLPEGSKGDLMVRKALCLNLNFSFLNRILLLLISNSYPIVLTMLGGPRSGPYSSRKISRVQPGIEPGTSSMAVRRANHYTKQAVMMMMMMMMMIIIIIIIIITKLTHWHYRTRRFMAAWT